MLILVPTAFDRHYLSDSSLHQHICVKQLRDNIISGADFSCGQDHMLSCWQLEALVNEGIAPAQMHAMSKKTTLKSECSEIAEFQPSRGL